MEKPIINIENLGKQYRLGSVGTGTLSHDINRWWHSVRGKEDPYLRVGDVNDRTAKDGSDYVWALQDINCTIEQGEILGIIGKNGAGKSTLLKLLSRVTAPTTGKITCHGRIASLLEVGTGFHPELTGRDNIYLNGAILGMSKSEISSKFDEIVSFAGCEKYIDTPVKRYSSGMYVRLAFAVAAHLEPDILVVDEVLAVGDSEFQKKAIGKMQDVSQNQGRTVLFVSHNLGSVSNLCNKGLVLQNGMSAYYGGVKESIDFYLQNQAGNVLSDDLSKLSRSGGLGTEIKFTKVSLYNSANVKTNDILYCESFSVEIEFESVIGIENINVGLRFDDQRNNSLVSTLSGEQDIYYSCDDKGKLRIHYKDLFFTPGQYFITLSLRKNGIFMDELPQCYTFEIGDVAYKGFKPHNGTWGNVKYYPKWELE